LPPGAGPVHERPERVLDRVELGRVEPIDKIQRWKIGA
jgi:hypothetical protein